MTRKHYLHLLPSLLCGAFSASALANAPAPAEKTFVDRLSGDITVDYSRNAYKSSSYNAQRSTGLNLRLNYTTDNNVTLTATGRTQYSYDKEIGWFPQDYWFSATKADIYKPTDWLNIGGDIRAALPLSELSDKTKLQTAVRGALIFGFDLSSWLEGLRFTYQPRALKNFHEYKTAGGRNLVEYDLSSYYELLYLYDKWFFLASATNNHSWTYKGNYNHPGLTHLEHIGYSITDKISIGAGHTNSISFFDPNQGPSPINHLLDYKHSTFYVLTTYKF